MKLGNEGEAINRWDSSSKKWDYFSATVSHK